MSKRGGAARTLRRPAPFWHRYNHYVELKNNLMIYGRTYLTPQILEAQNWNSNSEGGAT